MFVLRGGSGFVLSPVPECEGPGAPISWGKVMVTRSNPRFFGSLKMTAQ
jgi:hypothetical protein